MFFLSFLVVCLIICVIFLFLDLEKLRSELTNIKSKLIENGYDFRSSFELELDKLANKNIEINELENLAHYEPKELSPQFDNSEEKIEQSLGKDSNVVLENVEQITESSSFSFENLFLGNVFNKIGAIILVIAFGFFIKIVSDNFVFTPAMRIGIGYLLGLGLCGLSLKMHKGKFVNYAEVLLGISFSILFITMYCSATLYKMINAPTMCVIASLVLYGSYYIAQKYNTFSTIAIGLVGAYLCPIIVHNTPVNLLLTFFLFVNAITLVYTYKNPSKNVLDYINLLLVADCVIEKSLESCSIFLLVLFYAMYLTKHFLATHNQEKKDNVLLYATQIVFPGLVVMLNWHTDVVMARLYAFGFFAIVMSLYLILCKYNKRNDGYLYASMIALMGAVLTAERGVLIMACAAATSVLLIWLANKFELKALSNWGYSFLAYPILLAFIVKPEGLANLPNCCSKISLLLAIPLLASVASYAISKKYENNELVKVYKFISITLGYYMIAHALVTYLQNHYASQITETHSILTYASVGFLYSLNAIYAREEGKRGFLEIAGYFVYGASLLALLFCAPKGDILPFFNINTLVATLGIIVTVLINRVCPHCVYPYIASLIGLWGVSVNVFNAVQYDKLNSIAISVFWAVYAGVLLLLGILKNIKACKLVGIGIVIITIFRIFIIDMVHAELVHKLLGFLILGITLMLVSYIYTRKKN